MVSQQVYDDILKYFHYWPSKNVAIAALALFLIVTHTVMAMTIKTKAWYMMIAVVVGGLETMGYFCRVRMFSKPSYGMYVGMHTMLVLPPTCLALVQYLTLGKVVAAVQRAKPGVRLPLRGRALSWGYFAAEVASLAVQGAGAGFSVSKDVNGPKPKHESLGRALLILGLALLVVVMATYLANALYVHASPPFGVRASRSLSRLFATMYATTLLLLVRNVFRMIEFGGGWYGRLATDEKLFYILDALMIFLILVIFTVSHYGLYFKGYTREQQLLEQGKYERSVEVAIAA